MTVVAAEGEPPAQRSALLALPVHLSIALSYGPLAFWLLALAASGSQAASRTFWLGYGVVVAWFLADPGGLLGVSFG